MVLPRARRRRTTSKPSNGLPIGRKVVLANRDIDKIATLDKVDHITGRFFISGGMFGSDLSVRAGAKATSFDVRAVSPGHLYLEKTLMKAGRFIDERDLLDFDQVFWPPPPAGGIAPKPAARMAVGVRERSRAAWN